MMNTEVVVEVNPFQFKGVPLLSQRVFAASDAFRVYDARDNSIISSDDGWRIVPHHDMLVKSIYHAHPETGDEELGVFLVEFEHLSDEISQMQSITLV